MKECWKTLWKLRILHILFFLAALFCGTYLLDGAPPWGKAAVVETTAETVARLPSPQETSEASADGAAYYAESRIRRLQAQSRRQALLREQMQAEDAPAALQESAASELRVLALAVEQEAALEDLLLAKGFSQALVWISAGRVSIVLEAAELDAERARQAAELAAAQLEIDEAAIVIIPRGGGRER